MVNNRKLGEIFSLNGLGELYEVKGEVFKRLKVAKFCLFLEKNTFIRPDHITVFNFFLGVFGLVLLFKNPLALSILLIVHFMLDNLDGYYARVRKIQSRYGRYIDHVADFIIGVLYLIVSAAHYGEAWMWILLMLFCGEMFILLGLGSAEDKFPSRVFLIFYIFGWYRLGLVVQAIVQPLSFVQYLAVKRMKGRHFGSGRVN